MTKQTVQNMGLIISEMDKQAISDKGDYKALKALSHSYETLLSQLQPANDDFKHSQLTGDLSSQLIHITKIRNNIENTSIPELLKVGKYSDVNHLTTTTSRFINIINGLSDVLKEVYINFNKKVLIVGNTDASAHGLHEKIAEEEGIVELLMAFRSKMSLTKSSYIESTIYDERLEGKQYDEVFIDSNLDKDHIETCLNLVKDKNNIHMF